jgi:hypothetical protein
MSGGASAVRGSRGQRRARRISSGVSRLAILIAVSGCERGTPGPTAQPTADAAVTVAPMLPPSEASAAAALAAALGPADAGPHEAPDAGAPRAAATDPFHGKKVTAGKAIGHTSVVFKLTFADGSRAAFKPASHRGPARFRGEIAAYRLALALGLDNVPPAFEHDFVAADLRAALDPAAATLFADEAIVSDAGLVRGALIPWVEGLEFPPLERDPLHAQWSAALEHDAPANDGGVTDLASLAAQMSTLIVFDVLDGNWDRWSGGNIGRVKDTYLYIDNDGAFFPNPPAKAMARGWERLDEVDRFSKDLVSRLRAFDDADGGVLAASGLGDAAIKGFRERRTRVLAAIDAKIARYGEPSVLVFP